MKNLLYLFFTLFFCSSIDGQVPMPADEQSRPVLLLGGTAHIGNGQVIENAAIGFENGKISLVREATNALDASDYEVVDVKGRHIYPGFILPNSGVGLSEVSSVRAMRDQAETGSINPSVRSVISYNTDSEMIPTFRFNGILLAETTPVGGLISGTSSVMEMEGWNWEDAVHTMDIGIHLNWPVKNTRRFDFNTFTVKTEVNKKYKEQVDALKQHFLDARTYMNAEEKIKNLKMEAMKGLISGEKRLMIHAGQADEIIESIRMAQDLGVQHIVLITGDEALHVSAFLRENNIPVILPPTHSLPARTDAAIDRPYELPHLLTEAGIEVSLSHSGMLSNARNLPFYAGTAVAYGMTMEDALRTITSNPARALGIIDRVGTIEVGKDATIFVSEGDALDIRTNILSRAYISGKEITLDNKQQELYKRYSNKYGHNK